jgi:hypothetical protein
MFYVMVNFGHMYISKNDKQENEYQDNKQQDNIVAVFSEQSHVDRFS